MAKKKSRKPPQRAKKPKKPKKPTEPLTAKYLLLCDGVGREPGTGKVTLYGIFDVVFSHTFPGTLGSGHLVSSVRGDGEYDVTIAIIDPDGNRLPSPPTMKLNVTPDGAGMVQLTLTGFQLPKPGRYQFELRTGRRVVASVFVDVKKGPKK